MTIPSTADRITDRARARQRSVDRGPAAAPGLSRSGLIPLALFLLGGMALWLSLIAFNNATDFSTNRTLIGDTVSMKAIIADHAAGRGLEWRALPRGFAGPMLTVFITYQVLTAAFMWRAVLTGSRLLGGSRRDLAAFVRHANQSLMLFAGMFLGFLIGGLWFGYWMHLGPVQQVHFTLLIVGALLALLVNLVPIAESVLIRSTA
jgi:predicted small integral membrane protein